MVSYTDSSPLWVLLQLLTPGAGVISEAEEESDRIECALFLQGCAVKAELFHTAVSAV